MKLSPREQRVYDLHTSGRTTVQIAGLLGVQRRSVYSSLVRARAKLAGASYSGDLRPSESERVRFSKDSRSARPNPMSYECRQTLERAMSRTKTAIGRSEEDDPAKVKFFSELERKRKREARRK